MEQDQGRATKMTKGPELLSSKDRMRKLRQFRLKQRRLRGSDSCAQIPAVISKEERPRLFLVVPTVTKRGNGHKL